MPGNRRPFLWNGVGRPVRQMEGGSRVEPVSGRRRYLDLGGVRNLTIRHANRNGEITRKVIAVLYVFSDTEQ